MAAIAPFAVAVTVGVPQAPELTSSQSQATTGLIAVSAERRGTAAVIIRPLGPGRNRLLSLSGAAWSSALAFSPDGRQLAIASGSRGRASLLVANLHGGKPRPIWATTASVRVQDLAWAPDGGRLAFTVTHGVCAHATLHTIDVRSRVHRQVPLPGRRRGGWFSSVQWSPDSRRLLVVRSFSEDCRTQALEGSTVYVIDVRSGRTRAVVSDDYITDAAWDRRGARIAFARGCVQSCNLAVIDSAGGRPVPVTRFPVDYSYYDQMPLAWLDRDRVAIAKTISETLDERGVYAIRVADGQRKRLAPYGRFWVKPDRTSLLVAEERRAAIGLAVYSDQGALLHTLPTFRPPRGWTIGGLLAVFIRR